ncbi:MAG: hypothetical protein A3I20_00035 [Candidatus Portnoybacteria bacterium RIFCSPLOWO2_02_FULL_40_15]|uniref:Very-long-chain aldehyde decarbonylase CER1-like C-terminal domain-containing protein n=1 Tax=Candidatus Portnoybacteria bacterium RIFCSPLOWO2_02_FULL_40_15 TaxID=1802002 RepID=A0A1G2FQQ9_9BACT|nr:MAG: hypothetical protein A3I20_00035 [Candidatus Portnoybacteria bacterium RIFCSPLOWO2_02_FULL_40_15]
MEKKVRMTFVAHWVEPWNWLLWFIPMLHRKPEQRWYWVFLAPVYHLMSLVYLFGHKPFDVVDSFHFNGSLEGKTILIRNFAWHFSWLGNYEKIRQRILEAVLAAQESSDVIGLGALTKAEWITSGGEWIVKRLGSRLKVPIVHGDTLTAAAVIEAAKVIIRQRGIKQVFLTGASSKIGRAVALSLAQSGVRVKMFTQDYHRFSSIQAEARPPERPLLEWATDFENGRDCLFWITGKALFKGKRFLKYVPKESVILNFSVPNPFTPKDLRNRPDVKAIEGGLLAYDEARTDLSFTMRLSPGLTYACHAGTMVHARMGWTDHEVGQVELEKIPAVWAAARKLGFYLPREVAEATIAVADEAIRPVVHL